VSRQIPRGHLDDQANGRLIEVKDDSDYPYINAADVCLAPLSVGSGTRIKIANYLASGKAVVSTPVGCEGIPVANERELVVSEFEDFPAQVIRLLENSQMRSELGKNARDFAERSLSWERSVAAFQRLHEGLYSTNGN
jgi:glycosyltransferase involved in cell wall biosynthesis